MLLEDTSVLGGDACVLMLWQCESKSDTKVVSKTNRSHFLPIKLLDSLGGLPWDEVSVAELSNIIRAPSVAGARARDNSCETLTRDGEVVNV